LAALALRLHGRGASPSSAFLIGASRGEPKRLLNPEVWQHRRCAARWQTAFVARTASGIDRDQQ
jgi:hypothetical protein